MVVIYTLIKHAVAIKINFIIINMKTTSFYLLLAFICLSFVSRAQSPWDRIAERPSTLMLDKGDTKFTTKSFSLSLVNASQTVKHLIPHADSSFDYTPSDRISQRDKDGLYQLGDINISVRKSGDSEIGRASCRERV